MTTPTAHAANRAAITQLRGLAEPHGYGVEYIPTRHVRGWPTPSSKPFALYFFGGGHLASFATADALERNLRARAGC